LSFLWVMLVVCIPSAIFGVYSNITRIVMLPLVIIMSLWIVYLLLKTDTKKSQFVFFLGVFSVFISVSFLVAAYKIVATEIRISGIHILLIILAYVIVNILSIFNTLRLIKKRRFKVKGKNENLIGMIFASGLLGLSIGKVLMRKINQNTSVAILVIGLVFIGFLFSTGTNNFIKYYYIKKFRT